jgi:hypothetical protein
MRAKASRAKLILKICDPRGHRRLGQMQAFRRFAKPAKTRNPKECFNLVKGHN